MIIFTGQVLYDKVYIYVNAMDICIAPFMSTRGETSAVKIFDYFACAKPVVVSDIKSVHELMLESKGAILVPPEDPKCLAEAIIGLLGDRRERERLGNNGRKFVVDNYSWETLTRRTIEVCQDSLRGKGCFNAE